MLQVIKHKLQHIYQINRSNDSSSLVLSTNLPFHTFYIMVKLKKPFSHQSKKTNFCHFYRLKAVWRRKEKYNKPKFLFEILTVVCASFDWVPKVIHKSFQTMEKNLFNIVRQRLVWMLARPLMKFIHQAYMWTRGVICNFYIMKNCGPGG